MLQEQTVEPGTLSLLIRLMQMPELNNFLLVGGTAISLYYGHRKSDDLDLFSPVQFDNRKIIDVLEKNFSDFTYRDRNDAVGIFGFMGEVKVDFVQQYHHPLIDKPILDPANNLRLIGKHDLIAMKVNAIMKRAVKKDFWDIAELLNYYSVDDFIRFYQQKYPSQVLMISVPQAMVYFEEAEQSEDPISLKGQTWKSVKKNIQKKVSDYLK
jgi:predicted nucleotidyltransferase component of viral defense system